MSNIENTALRVCNTLKPTQSLDELLNEIVNDDDSVEVQSLNLELLNDETNDINRVITKRTDDFVTKISLDSAIFNSKSKGNVEQNDCYLSPDCDQYPINLSGKYSDRYLSTQDSVCTECKFGNKQISFFSSFNNTQRQTQTNCSSPTWDQVIDKRSLQKRSLSVTPEKKHSDIHKKFKSDDNISIPKNKIIKPTTVIPEISKDNFTDIFPTTELLDKACGGNILPEAEHDDTSKHTVELDRTLSKHSDRYKGSPDALTQHKINLEKLQRTENVEKCPTVKKIEEIPMVENVSADKETNHSLSSENIVLQSENFDEINSSCSCSSSSQSTVEEIYWIDDIDDIEHSENVESLIEELHDTDSSESSSSVFSKSTIEEVFYMNTADDTESRTRKDMEKGSTVIETRTEDGLESQSLIETQLIRIEPEDEIAASTVVAVQLINNPVTDVDSAKVPGLRNEGDCTVLDDSVLEISVETELDNIVKQGCRIVGREKISSVPVVDNSKLNSADPKKGSEQKRETINVPIDLTTANQSSISHVRDIIPSKAVNTKNVETTILLDDFNTQLLTDTQLDNIELQDQMAIKKMTCLKDTIDPSANTSLTKTQSTSSRNVENFEEDLSLEFLSDGELQRIEDEAYKKDKGRSATNLKNVNAKGVNKEDIFYRPEGANMITNKSSDDLVIPSWVTNPAPEPNYDKMKRAMQVRREYIKKMLQEILRLSTIVSKVGNIIHAEHGKSSPEAVPESSLQIEEGRPIPLTEDKPSNQTLVSGVSTDAEMNTSHYSGHAMNTNLKNSEIFYVPSSSRPKCSVNSNTVLATAHNLSTDAKGSGKLYDPRSIQSKNDFPPIFNRASDLEFKRGNISGNYVESGASNMFGSLKRDFNGNRSCGFDSSSVLYSGRESETRFHSTKWDSNGVSKNRETNREGVMKAECQLPKINLHSTVSDEDKVVLNTNKFKPVGQNDTIFYSPDQFTAVSSKSIKNIETRFSQSSIKQPLAQLAKRDLEPKSISRNLTRDNNSVFYTGNNKKGVTFKIL